MYRARHRLTTALALGLAISVSGACDTRIQPVPELDPQVVNLRNSFNFQAVNLLGVIQQVTYQWQIDGTTATVAQSPTALIGDATVFVTDAKGVQVYQRSLAENGSFTTATGVPGTWTIRLRFNDASGDVAVQLNKQGTGAVP
ncbi:MAG: hypothetical protein JF589_03760 [Gemmatimonadetes bacterium]|nr:hypothetical protein [Gemmatimonadota bacterium]